MQIVRVVSVVNTYLINHNGTSRHVIAAMAMLRTRAYISIDSRPKYLQQGYLLPASSDNTQVFIKVELN